MKGKLFLFLLTALAAGVLIVLSYRENVVETFPSYKTSSMHGFHLTHKERDKIRWELAAEKATFPAGNKEIVLNELTMKIYDRREVTITGGSGLYEIENKRLTINKPLEIDVEGARLTTDSLVWDGEKGIITTGDDVRFKGEKFNIEGTGLKVNVKEQQIRIFKNVKGTFYR
ncbi:MAG TPA: LPS export ABC transporter periplasmic protein LptC [Nitrospirae bacterium]|nr:lipopolysaccharide-assembly, LptC-related [bacterium BMS3Abin10]GBE38380.1 lipopolysaccharide-assembly, LptC-related [bacterium BMS3Bbin08]HDH51113.1 LPS export ABC transporter periplasmic protein LptC [Nitrospirota bacterium]HDK41294.1 LPS export ABC transporter periplasmic protein LptC [Nitrospirota bacterium]HDK81627.1 LPS export ABC transporter periplasmic protein LptC [Nitrospirota bacterium]